MLLFVSSEDLQGVTKKCIHIKKGVIFNVYTFFCDTLYIDGA